MAEHLGIGLVEQLLVDTMVDLAALPSRPFQKSQRILEALHDRHDVPIDQGHDAMVELGADWLLPLQLVQHHGNFGAPGCGPAAPRYTEARLTKLGVLAARRPGAVRLPIGLINGDLQAGGRRPSFAPLEILDAVALAAREPSCSDDDLVALVSGPIAPTGSLVHGELAALRDGRPGLLRIDGRITPSADGTRLVLDRLPPDVDERTVCEVVDQRIRRPTTRHDPDCELAGRDEDEGLFDELAAADDLGIARIREEWDGHDNLLVATLRPGADPTEAARRLLDVWPIGQRYEVQLPAPLADQLRAEVDPDPTAQLAVLAKVRALLA